MEVKQYGFATYFRVLGVILILLCHFVQQSTNTYLNLTAQFFNIGVNMFFILSGFLFGIRGGQNNVLPWYKKRVKRIYIPYELFIIFLLIVHCCCRLNVLKIDWLFLVLGLQGSVVGVLGAEQTWFITALLLCYLVTPVISRLLRTSDKTKRIVFVIFLLPTILGLIPDDCVFTLIAPICWYTVAYFAGMKYDKIQITKNKAIAAFLLMCMSFTVRILSRFCIDGTIIYNHMVVGYTQTIAAFCIFYIVAWLTKKRTAGRIISFISVISFEIYLYHYMFTVGPVQLFGLTGNWILDSLVVTIITISLAFGMNKLSRYITRKCFK